MSRMPKTGAYGKQPQVTRKKVQDKDLMLDGIRTVQEQIPQGYLQSLKSARERNRKRLQNNHPTETTQKEKMEQGFILYFQGANQDRKHSTLQKPQMSEYRGYPKTSGGERNVSQCQPLTWRAKTAPDEDQGQATSRKKWDRPAELKLCGLDRTDALKSEYYSDDFEDENDYSDSSSSDDIPYSYDPKTTKEKLMLSIDDVKSLRLSLNLMETKSKQPRDTSDMKEIAEEIADEVIHESMSETETSKNPAMVVLELQPRTRPTKQLGLTYRKGDNDNEPTPSRSISSVINALDQENHDISKMKKNTRTSIRESTSESSPQTKSKGKSSLNDSHESDQSSAHRLQFLLERVMQLSQNQQKNLAGALADIEIASHDPKLRESMQAQPPTKTDRKLQKEEQQKITEENVVKLELTTNWGHPSKIGLTEVEIFNENKEYIEDIDVKFVDSNGVCCDSTHHPDLNNLINRRKKTTKERFMWSTAFNASSPKPMQLQFCLGSSDVAVAKIVIWNYNQTVKNLDIGVRECRVYYKNSLVFNDEVEKGCGNQVFDYGIVIPVKPEKQKTAPGKSLPDVDDYVPKPISEQQSSDDEILCSAASLHRSQEDKSASTTPRSSVNKGLKLSHSGKALESKKTTALSPRDVVKSPTAKNVEKEIGLKKLSPIKSPLKGSIPKGEISKDISESKKVPEVAERKEKLSCSTDDDDCLLNQLQEYQKSKGRKSSPHWLKNKEEKGKMKKNDSLSLEGWSPPIGGRVDLQTELDRTSPDGEKQARFGRRSQAGSRAESRATSRQGAEKGKCSGSDSDEKLEGRGTPMQKLISAREKRLKEHRKNVFDLEQSWSSLNFFDKFHAGRISTDFQADALDECLQKKKTGKQVIEERKEEEQEEEMEDVDAPISPVPEEDDEGLWSDDEFCIPELPRGRELMINIRTTWGDRHYVGLTGIEAFSANGELCDVSGISAQPEDINILPGYGSDPRVVSNLIDGVNKTRDDTHMWLSPFTAGENHVVTLTFSRAYRLALIRIWNYNKSRIHSSRGACDVEILLDGKFIFKGEISRSSGTVGNETGETILFTTDESILEKVAENDEEMSDGDSLTDVELDKSALLQTTRPQTSDKGSGDGDLETTARPFTCANRKRSEPTVEKVSTVKFDFTSTWGDEHYLGLTGLEIVGANGETIPLNLTMLNAQPRDLRVLPGCESDSRTLDKLINDVNVTNDDENMWLIPFTEGDSHIVEISLAQPSPVTGFRVWNYNKSVDDAYRGAHSVHVFLNDKKVSPDPSGFILRRAPGYCAFDFAQEILFADVDKFCSPYQQPGSPCGFVYRLDLLSTWGDQYYVGLSGIELLGLDGKVISVSPNNVTALPDSVNILPGMEGDVRTVDKLIDGVNDYGGDGQHCWLTPILPELVNRVYIIFDYPVSVSVIRLWNYAKTSSRGVRDFSVLVDDLLVFSGTLPPVSSGARGVLPTLEAPQRHHSVILAENTDVAKREPRGTILNGQTANTDGQDVKLTNDRQVVSNYAKSPEKAPDPQLRPKTSVTGAKHSMKRR